VYLTVSDVIAIHILATIDPEHKSGTFEKDSLEKEAPQVWSAHSLAINVGLQIKF